MESIYSNYKLFLQVNVPFCVCVVYSDRGGMQEAVILDIFIDNGGGTEAVTSPKVYHKFCHSELNKHHTIQTAYT